MGRVAQKIAVGVALLFMISGCMPRSSELTFAGDDVMLRGIETVTTHVEYYDATAKVVKVKKATVTPPFWIVNENMLQGK